MTACRALFVSHGAPTMVLDRKSPARAFLTDLGRRMERPRAVLCITAHWETDEATVGGAGKPDTIHDFHGFPDGLYELAYAAPGAPAVAARAASLLRAAGEGSRIDMKRGLDHGTWVPLMLMFPDADIPVAQLPVMPARGPAAHLEVGRILRPLLDDGVLIVGSGGAVHNLADFRPGAEMPAPWAVAFEEWLVDAVTRGAAEDVAAYREKAPDGAMAHPRDEHFLPLPVVMGAAGEGAAGTVLHRGFEHGSVGMAAFGF